MLPIFHTRVRMLQLAFEFNSVNTDLISVNGRVEIRMPGLGLFDCIELNLPTHVKYTLSSKSNRRQIQIKN